jgi:UPF0755 protein
MKYTSRVQKRRWPKRLIIAGAILLVMVLAAIIAVRHVYFDGLKPVGGTNQTARLVTIESGATLNQIAEQLKKAGLIRSPWAFKLYVGSKNARDALQAGTYSLSPTQNVAQVVAQLSHGKVATDLVTIVPGQRLEQIRTTLLNYGFNAADVETALNPQTYLDHPALVDKPPAANLEGYIYPDSYQKNANTLSSEIIMQALSEMNKRLTPELRSAFAAQGLSTYEAIILASVVEREVPSQSDRNQAAQVFLKRLRGNIALESNATEHYFDSYNNPGLPPTPISNVSVSSLQAVARPANTDWLYFVSGDDGITRFSRTLAEHEANVQKYCHKLCR